MLQLKHENGKSKRVRGMRPQAEPEKAEPGEGSEVKGQMGLISEVYRDLHFAVKLVQYFFKVFFKYF